MRSWFNDHIEKRKSFEELYQSTKQDSVLISIGIITYQRPKLLMRVLDALIPQINCQIEIVVVVDGIDRETMEVLQRYQNSGLQAVVHDKNMGRPKARNAVVCSAKGEYILWVDDDDLPSVELIPTYLEFINRYPEIDVGYVDLELVHLSSGKVIGEISGEDITGSRSTFLQNLILGKGIPSIGSIVRRSLYYQVGGFDERFYKAQDTEFWFRIAPIARFHKIPRKLYKYYRHGRSITFQTKDDCSYTSFAIRNCLQRVPLEEIFPELNWNDPKRALAKALFHIAKGMINIGDKYNANRYMERVSHDCYPKDLISLHIRCTLALGKSVHALGIINTLRTLEKRYDNDTLIYYRNLIKATQDLEQKGINALKENNKKAVRKILRDLKENIGTGVFSSYIFSERFHKIGDYQRAIKFMEQVLRFDPTNEMVYAWLAEKCKNEKGKEKLDQMRVRMMGEIPSAPLYRLSLLETPGQMIVPQSYSYPLQPETGR